MAIPDHLTCLLRNLYSGREATESDMEQWTGSKLEKAYVKAVYCHSDYLTFIKIMQNIRVDESQAEIKTARRNINNSGMQMMPL